jgi:hypothetical protein
MGIEQDSEDLESVARKRYEYLSAILRCVIRNVDKGYVSGEVIKKIIDVFVDKNLVRSEQSYADAIERYRQRYGEPKPVRLL